MEVEKIFKSSIVERGRKQIEIKTDYVLRRTRKKKQRFCLNAYIYTPSQLGIHNERYSKETFFHNFVSHTRYKTPSMSFDELLSPGYELSPLIRLQNVFYKKDNRQPDEKYVIYELKTLLNIFQKELRLKSNRLVRGIKSGKYAEDYILENSGTLLDQVESIHRIIRKLMTETADRDVSEVVRKAFSWVDEGLSLRMEKSIGRLYNSLSKKKILPGLCERSIKIISDEIDLRQQAGYGTRVSISNPGRTEYLLYREQQIKKWAESSMYMSQNETKTIDRLIQIMFGAAAAVAMTFAVVASILSLRWFDSGSVYWAIIAVIAYILKDRMKDGLRIFFTRFIPRFIADKVQIIIDPRSGVACGKTKERIFHRSIDTVPSAVQTLRYKNKDVLLKELVSEDIIQYQKTFVINSNRLLSEHKRISSLNDIMRLDMRQWFYRMDTDREFRMHYNGETLNTVKIDRLYHFTIILGMSEVYSGIEEELKRYRIVANSNGIKRIDEVR
ncbi:hypothetical protein [Spirochaeta isovalerica]|uniref:Uncharacterized protein n=1 Tax=Spirochaeta isovalerica TaxID=150 RepID=A0A841REZ0_9SPIO|nr:hypothetical protein [Spirochaeta isovalerica]MBB6482176.1 hypothetical protein [Spirochaeta isovalerica]